MCTFAAAMCTFAAAMWTFAAVMCTFAVVMWWGQSQIKDHPSPAKARVGAELGNNGVQKGPKMTSKWDILKKS